MKNFNSAPYLFIGSGLSSRYINTLGWASLLTEICKELDLPNNFHYYNSKANNDLTVVASLMAEDLFESWWKEENLKKRVEKNSKNL